MLRRGLSSKQQAAAPGWSPVRPLPTASLSPTGPSPAGSPLPERPSSMALLSPAEPLLTAPPSSVDSQPWLCCSQEDPCPQHLHPQQDPEAGPRGLSQIMSPLRKANAVCSSTLAPVTHDWNLPFIFLFIAKASMKLGEGQVESTRTQVSISNTLQHCCYLPVCLFTQWETPS